jgi:hypothetical protein
VKRQAVSIEAGTKARGAHLLLRQPDLPHQFRVPRVGAQRIERRVGPNGHDQDAAFLVRDVEPLEGVVLIIDIAVQFGNLVRSEIVGLRFVFRGQSLDSLVRGAGPSTGAKTGIQRGSVLLINPVA